MKVLFAAYKVDPRNSGTSSSASYQFFRGIASFASEIRVVDPVSVSGIGVERKLIRLYRRMTDRSLLKFPPSVVWRASQVLNDAERNWRPDVVFTVFPAPLALYTGHTPCVYRMDAPYHEGYSEYPDFGYSLRTLFLTDWVQRRALAKSTKIVTHSTWCRDILINEYGIEPNSIALFANPAAVPSGAVPVDLDVVRTKALSKELNLLFVGRSPHLKGLDIAIETIHLINKSGCAAHLIVCGCRGPESSEITYVGTFDKTNATDLTNYVKLYQEAHLLIHPARYDSSPMVTSEAAAFGTPTVTNDVGGLSTSVKDGVSGIVLPKNSTAHEYTRAVLELVANPSRYYALCQTTRKRYDEELNWDVASTKLSHVFADAIHARKQQ